MASAAVKKEALLQQRVGNPKKVLAQLTGEPLPEPLRQAANAYLDAPTLENALNLSAMARRAYFDTHSPDIAHCNKYLAKEIRKSRAWKSKLADVKKSLDGINPRKVYITKEDAEHLLALTERLEHRGPLPSPAVEYSGGARIKRTGENARLKLMFSNLERLPYAGTLEYGEMLRTNVNAIWHTHPSGRTAFEQVMGLEKEYGPSKLDLRTARSIPVLTVENRAGRIMPLLSIGRKQYLLKIRH